MAHLISVDGGKIRQLRLMKGLMTSELAEKVGITERAMVEIEDGKRQIREKTLFSICKALEIDVAAFLNVAPAAPATPEGGRGGADKATA